MPSLADSPNDPSPIARPVVSHTTILILSGLLIGMVAGSWTHPNVQMPVFVAGVLGLVMYIGVSRVAQRRQQSAHQTRERSLNKLEIRLNRHVSHAHDPWRQRPHLRRANAEHQYLPVVMSRDTRARE